MSQFPLVVLFPLVQARVQATAASASDPRWRGERGERGLEMLEMLEMARQIRWPQIIKFLPVGAGSRLHRAAPCSVHHPILAVQISPQRRSWHPHTQRHCSLLASNRLFKTKHGRKYNWRAFTFFLQNEIGFIQSQLFFLIIWWSHSFPTLLKELTGESLHKLISYSSGLFEAQKKYKLNEAEKSEKRIFRFISECGTEIKTFVVLGNFFPTMSINL